MRLVEASALRLEPRLRSTPIAAAIPTIPYAAIASFLSRPTVMTKSEANEAPHIVAFRDDHQIAGSGVIAYVSGLGSDPHGRYNVMHVSDRLRDPDTGRTLGYLGIYTATALITQPATHPAARAELIDTARETLRGDKLISTDVQVPLDLVPRAPSTEVHGKVAWIVGDTGVSDLAGQYDIVVLNRGSDAGLEPGNVLEVDKVGGVVRDINATNGADALHGRPELRVRTAGAAAGRARGHAAHLQDLSERELRTHRRSIQHRAGGGRSPQPLIDGTAAAGHILCLALVQPCYFTPRGRGAGGLPAALRGADFFFAGCLAALAGRRRSPSAFAPLLRSAEAFARRGAAA